MARFLLFFLFAFLHHQYVAAQVTYTPLSTITVDVAVEGVPGYTTAQTTAVIEVSDALNEGDFRIGTFNVHIQADPPTWNYKIREVGRVPLAMSTHTMKVCAVSNAELYEQSTGAAASATYEDPIVAQEEADFESSNGLPGARRRLLQTTTQTTSTSVGAGINPFPPLSAQAVLNSLSAAFGGNIPAPLSAWVNEASELINGNNRVTLADQIQITNLQTSVGGLTTDTSLLNTMIQTVAKNLSDSQTLLEGLVNQALVESAGYTNDKFNATLLLVGQLTEAVSNLTEQVQQSQFNMAQDFINLDAAVADLNSAVFYEITQTSLRRAASTAYFNAIASVSPVFMPLVLDPGTPPVNGGILSGPDTRILLDSYFVMFERPQYNGQNPIAYSYQIQWYLNTEVQLTIVNPSMSLLRMLATFSAGNCTRPFADNQKWVGLNGLGVSDGVNAGVYNTTGSPNYCTGWFDVIEQSCVASQSYFEWILNNGETAKPWYMDPDLSSTNNIGLCKVGAAVQTVYRSIKGFNDLLTYTSTQMCSNSALYETGSGKFTVGSSISQQVYAFTQPTSADYVPVCLDSINDQVTEAITVFGFMLKNAYFGYAGIYNRLLELEQKQYGRLPGGLTYTSLPFDDVPPVGNSTNTGAYSPRMCHEITVNLAHTSTLPVYAVYPDPAGLVTKSISQTISQTDDTIPLFQDNFLGNTTVLHDNILLVDDSEHLLPGNTLLIGDLSNPLTTSGAAGTIYVYDVPDRLLEVSSNIFARKNTATYYLMPPGTTTTWSLPTFNANNNNLYDANDAAVGVNLFAVPTAYDPLGSLVCNVGSGLPDQNALNGANALAQRVCTGQNTWDANTISATILSTICPALGTLAGMQTFFMYNRAVDLLSYTSSSPIVSPWLDGSDGLAFHFLLEGHATVTPIYDVTLLGSNGEFSSITTTISVTVDFFLQQVLVTIVTATISSQNAEIGGTTQYIVSTAPSLYAPTLSKHSILVFFTSSSDGFAGIAIDGILDQFVPMTLPIPPYRSGSYWSVPGLSSVAGVEAVYGIIWSFTEGSLWLTDRFSAIAAEALRICSYAVAENHCAPSTGTETLVFGGPTTSIVETNICPSNGVLLYRTALVDQSNVNAQIAKDILTASAAFSVTWWMHLTTSWFRYRSPTQPPAYGNTFNVFVFHSGSFSMTASIQTSPPYALNVLLTFSGAIFANLTSILYTLPSTLVPTKIALVYQSGSLQFYVNNVLDQSATPTTSYLPQNGGGFIITYFDQQMGASMLRVYSGALNSNTRQADYLCDTNSISSYIPTTGYCRETSAQPTPQPGGTLQLYCRSPALCNGNCETISTYCATGCFPAKSFVSTQVNECDDGWLDPLCTSPCAYPSNTTGVCLTNDIADPATLGSSLQLVPTGTWCEVLKNYVLTAPIVAPGQIGSLLLQPRSFIMQATTVIPSGQITVLTPSGLACPTIEATGAGNNAYLQLGNPNSASSISCTVAWSTNDPSCTAATLTYNIVVRPNLPTYVPMPPCGNISAIISVYATSIVSGSPVSVQQTECQQLATTDIADLVSGTSATQISAIASSTTYYVDSGLALVSAIASSMAYVTSAMLTSTGLEIVGLENLLTELAVIYGNITKLRDSGLQAGQVNHTFTDPCAVGTYCWELGQIVRNNTNQPTKSPIVIIYEGAQDTSSESGGLSAGDAVALTALILAVLWWAVVIAVLLWFFCCNPAGIQARKSCTTRCSKRCCPANREHPKKIEENHAIQLQPNSGKTSTTLTIETTPHHSPYTPPNNIKDHTIDPDALARRTLISGVYNLKKSVSK
jgi:hypothetical protein